MRDITLYFSFLVALFAAWSLSSCKSSDVLPGRVPYRAFVDSVRKVNNEHATIAIPSKSKYVADGGMTYSDLRTRMTLARAMDNMSSEENQKKRQKAIMSHWMDHPLDIGGFTAEYMLSSDEKVRVFTRFSNAYTVDSAVFRIDSAFVEKGRKQIPVKVCSSRFTMVRNPPLNYIFTCSFKYRRKWYSLYQHVDIEKNPSFNGHETLCERMW